MRGKSSIITARPVNNEALVERRGISFSGKVVLKKEQLIVRRYTRQQQEHRQEISATML
jgi:hypothetical protein